ncbi:MAG: hypothetical protein ACOCWQ_00615 [Nanoarchaeota archaeon]
MKSNIRTVILACLAIITLLTSASAVNAERYVLQDTYEALIRADGTRVTDMEPLNDVNVVGYVCSSADCATTERTLFSPTSTGADNRIQLTYPTVLQNHHGYGIIFYKPGYVTWEVKANWYGTNSNDPQGPFNAFLSKVEGCRAPVDTFRVINDAHPNQPIMINVSTSLDANTRSALSHSGPLDIVPSFLESYYQVETQLRLEILDEQGNQVHSESRIFHIDFDSHEYIQFTWTPTETGRYTARVTSNVLDSKCESKFPEYSQKEFSIINQGPKEFCYVLLNNLSALPVKQKIDDPLTISVESIANYYDEFGELHPLAAQLHLSISHQGAEVHADDAAVPVGQVDQYQTTTFNYVTEREGEHGVQVTATAPNCPYDNITTDIVSQSYFVEGSQPPVFTALPDQEFFKNSGLHEDILDLDDYASDAENDPLQFAIEQQSNTDVVTCDIDSQNMVDCEVQPGETGMSAVTFSVTDGSSFSSQIMLVSVVAGEQPTLAIPDITLPAASGQNDNVIDLFDYADDAEDTDEELAFEIISQEDEQSVICQIDADRFIDCTVLTDQDASSEIGVRVTDTQGNTASDTFTVIIDSPIGETQCSDGIDNDNDGAIDLDDPGCEDPLDDSEANYFDLFTDDYRLVGAPVNDSTPAQVFFHTHAVNNTVPMIPVRLMLDGTILSEYTELEFPVLDGHIDTVIDLGVLSAGTHEFTVYVDPLDVYNESRENNNIRTFTFTINSTDIPECQDNQDNDNDGLTDAEDPGCWVDTEDPDTYDPDLDDEGRATSACQDGIDNDGDGLIDMEDPGCEDPQDYSEYNPKTPECYDGIDNDGDGLVDMEDPACQEGRRHEHEDPLPEKYMFISNIRLVDGPSGANGQEKVMYISLRNKGETDLDNVKINIFVPELAVRGSAGPFDLDEGESETSVIPIWDMYDIQPGIYLARVSIWSDDVIRIKHREFIVEGDCGRMVCE